jgi:hypothetical protein
MNEIGRINNAMQMQKFLRVTIGNLLHRAR